MVKPSRSLGFVLAVVALCTFSLDARLASAAAGPNPGNLVYVAVTPCRMVNTGLAGGPLIAGTPRTFTFRGPTRDYTTQGGSATGCGIPDLSGGGSSSNLAKAVAVNVFAVSPVSDGDIRAWPSDQGVPLAAILTYAHVGTLAFANGVILPMCTEVGATPCASGDVTFRADFGNTNLIVDVVGYFTEGTTVASNSNAALGHAALSSNSTGSGNTALGSFTLSKNTTGYANTAIGTSALQANTAGVHDTAVGNSALLVNVSGSHNTALGASALENNIGGSNTAVGDGAMYTNSSGSNNSAFGVAALPVNLFGSDNTAFGAAALGNNSTGNANIALGTGAGYAITQSNNIDIGNQGFAGDSATIRIGTAGTQGKAFMAGIHGVTTGTADAVTVMIDSNGQLGTVNSSRRFKEDIRDMADASSRIFDLRPVTFRYRPEVQAGDRPTEFGLIAEEVEQAFPELVVYGKDGRPETVKYHLLVPLLLNELQKEREARREDVARLEADADAQRRTTAALLRRLAALENAPPRAPSGQHQ